MEHKTDIKKLSAKILEGINDGLRQMVRKKAAANESIVIADKNGRIQTLLASDVLKKWNEEADARGYSST